MSITNDTIKPQYLVLYISILYTSSSEREACWHDATIVKCPGNHFPPIPRHAPLGRDFGQAPTPPRCHLFNDDCHDSRLLQFYFGSEAPALGFSCPDLSFRGPGSEATHLISTWCLYEHVHRISPMKTYWNLRPRSKDRKLAGWVQSGGRGGEEQEPRDDGINPLLQSYHGHQCTSTDNDIGINITPAHGDKGRPVG